MSDNVLVWAKGHRDAWMRSLRALRSGVLATSELRNGRRVDTTLETIAERKTELAELDAAIGRQEADGG